MKALLLGGLAVAAGWGLKSVMDKRAAEKAAEDQRKAALEPATSLKAGTTYTIQLMTVGPKVETRDAGMMSNVIKTTLQQMGFEVSGTPAPKDAAEAGKFQAGQNSQWIVPGAKWTRPETSIPQGPEWLGMAVAYGMPVISGYGYGYG